MVKEKWETEIKGREWDSIENNIMSKQTFPPFTWGREAAWT